MTIPPISWDEGSLCVGIGRPQCPRSLVWVEGAPKTGILTEGIGVLVFAGTKAEWTGGKLGLGKKGVFMIRCDWFWGSCWVGQEETDSICLEMGVIPTDNAVEIGVISFEFKIFVDVVVVGIGIEEVDEVSGRVWCGSKDLVISLVIPSARVYQVKIRKFF